MNNPFFWLGVSILLVAISLMALLTVAIFTLQELARAARSAEKLLDTLHQELPATLQDLRLTGKELSGLSDEVSSSVQSARNVVDHLDQGITDAKTQARKAQITTRSLVAGASAAFRVLSGKPRRRRRPPTRRPPIQPTPAEAPTAKPKTKLTDELALSRPFSASAKGLSTKGPIEKTPDAKEIEAKETEAKHPQESTVKTSAAKDPTAHSS